MSRSKGEEKAAYRPPVPLPRRPERPEESGWPSPTPMPAPATEDLGRAMKQVLDRLEAIEKRLENIEKMLMTRQPV
ncbi:MAG TPA: hypothetical protein VJ249_11410 [Candidatus Bathyarchaeia archaeon]|nr:hypothetical protein [Candidatus Bathyarchaeia archaeon]